MPDAAIGFRVRSGWATLIAVAGSLDAPVVLERRRVELIDATTFAQPYHAAEGLPLEQAAPLIGRCRDVARRMAAEALAARVSGYRTVGCGLIVAAGRPLPDLAQILLSHALIHTADGELFREAIRAAAGEAGLPVVEVKEREAASMMTITIAEAGKAMGPPWRVDEKLATLAGCLALAR